jgi:sugar-specific transcriptional regulator TrmB
LLTKKLYVTANDEETIETLTDLGLTMNQARAYAALVRHGPATAKEIAKNTNITRQDIYRIMPSLHKVGIVETTITNPTKFKALPIKQGVSILLNRKVAEHKSLEIKAEKIVKQLEKNQVSPAKEEGLQFVIIPEKEAHLQKMKELIKNVKTSLDIVTCHQRIPQATVEFYKERVQALKNGAEIRVVSDKPQIMNAAMKKIMALDSKYGLKIKHVDNQPLAVLFIFDKKEVVIINSATAALSESPSLFSNNPCLVALAQNYFESLWNLTNTLQSA